MITRSWFPYYQGWQAFSHLVRQHSVGGEICEVTGGVGGVAPEHSVAHLAPVVALDVPVDADLQSSCHN